MRLNSWAGFLLLAWGILAPAGAAVSASALPQVRFVSNVTGNVFTADQGVVDLVLDPDVRGGGTVMVTDELGKDISTVTIPAGADKVNVQLVRKGFYRLSADLAKADGTRSSYQATAAVVGPLLPVKTRLQSPFGLMGALELTKTSW